MTVRLYTFPCNFRFSVRIAEFSASNYFIHSTFSTICLDNSASWAVRSRLLGNCSIIKVSLVSFWVFLVFVSHGGCQLVEANKSTIEFREHLLLETKKGTEQKYLDTRMVPTNRTLKLESVN